MKHAKDSLGRRSRMRAHSTGKRIRLTERDMIWLQALHRHGPLASSYLLEFSKPLGMNKKRGRERLGDLFHENNTLHGGPYLTRPPQQFQTIDSRYKQLVYDLAPAGINALKQTGLWSDRSGPNGGPWWHKFMVSSITGSIELGTMLRGDVAYISQARILERANCSLSFPVTYRDPASQTWFPRDLRPDALFGLEHDTSRGRRYRFFLVEADRATEPITSANPMRKSFGRSFGKYSTFLAEGLYKKQLILNAPMLVMNVFSSEARLSSVAQFIANQVSTIEPAVLLSVWSDFASPTNVPNVWTRILNHQWRRASSGSMLIV